MFKLLLSLLLFIMLDAKEIKKVFTQSKINNNIITVWIVNKQNFDITLKYSPKYTAIKPLSKINFTKSFVAKTKTKIGKFKILKKKFKLSNKYQWAIGNMYSKHNDNYKYRLPYKIGTTNIVTQGFNGKFSHKGNSLYAVDFGLRIGTKVYAARGGTVVALEKKHKKSGNTRNFSKYANYVTIRHNDGTYGKYNHFKKNGIIVQVGEKVERGELIGFSGNTGFTNGPHLHFVVFKGKDYKSRESLPIKFVGKSGTILEPIKGKRYTAVQ